MPDERDDNSRNEPQNDRSPPRAVKSLPEKASPLPEGISDAYKVPADDKGISRDAVHDDRG